MEAAAVALQMNKEKEERLAEMRRKLEGELETEKEKLKEVGEKKEKAEEELRIEVGCGLLYIHTYIRTYIQFANDAVARSYVCTYAQTAY